MLTLVVPVVPVLRRMVSIVASVLPSRSDDELLVTLSVGPSSSRMLTATDEAPMVEPEAAQLHEETYTPAEMFTVRSPSFCALSTTPSANSAVVTPAFIVNRFCE